MSIVKTSSKGQVVIPKEIRKKLGIIPGKKVLLQIVDQHVEIIPLPDDPIKALKGILKGVRLWLKSSLWREKRITKWMKKIVFDPYAILKFSQDEEGADRIEEILNSSQQGKIESFINQINLGEAYYRTIRRVGLDSAKRYLESFCQLPIKVILPSSEIIFSASEIKAKYAMSYAVCFAAATALKHEASIITGDPEFKKLENIVRIEWV